MIWLCAGLQVSIDANGLLKVTHLMPFTHSAARGAAAGGFSATPALSAFGNTQQVSGAGVHCMCVAECAYGTPPAVAHLSKYLSKYALFIPI